MPRSSAFPSSTEVYASVRLPAHGKNVFLLGKVRVHWRWIVLPAYGQSVYRTPALPPEPQVNVEVYSVVVNFSPKLQIHRHVRVCVLSKESAASMTISVPEPVMGLSHTPATDWGEIGKTLTVETLVCCTEVTDTVCYMSHLVRDAPTHERLNPFLNRDAKTPDEKLRAATASAVSAVELRIVSILLVAIRCMQDSPPRTQPTPGPNSPHPSCLAPIRPPTPRPW
ncbi:unnamed protein product [Vitrella brassicaformis CCMP3155]|uniref:Uncharacterized protein n=1 Tax=Vitrella brassicaformis (strain CCMP3155) TaxID=1169540 RepID=A0A0G4ELU7_VITBC|nr:unnamed protein product [Vitrella brassicaformis CCMP3155]|eukprot:CEL97942.1 unnamed protein product [Vitrella brassicaformis CCMP3155]